jgi:myo-inositol 2-dehydrogenase/D-chiro-inositol 1-dehydrogenase
MTLHIGMVGTGSFALKHCRLLQGMDGVEVTAICGSSQEKADALAKQFTNAKGYASIHHMVDSQRLDAVYICVPPFAHGEIELVLAQRGIPFLVEKPLGPTLKHLQLYCAPWRRSIC